MEISHSSHQKLHQKNAKKASCLILEKGDRVITPHTEKETSKGWLTPSHLTEENAWSKWFACIEGRLSNWCAAGPNRRKEGRRRRSAAEIRLWKGEHCSPDGFAVSVGSFWRGFCRQSPFDQQADQEALLLRLSYETMTWDTVNHLEPRQVGL